MVEIKYELNELIPAREHTSIVKVVGTNYYLVMYGGKYDITWKELLEKAVMNKKEKHGTCLIIIENALRGKVYQFGNYDRKYVYEHGTTEGYA